MFIETSIYVGEEVVAGLQCKHNFVRFWSSISNKKFLHICLHIY